MAWNVPQSGKTPQKRKANGSLRPLFLSVAVLIGVVGVGVAVWLVSNSLSEPVVDEAKKDGNKASTIAVAKPAAKPSKPEVKSEEPIYRTNRWGKVVKREKPETYRDERGVLRYKNGNARVPRPDDFKNPIRIENSTGLPHFNHAVETEIATLISIQPGETIVGEISYRGFDNDFVNSLLEKIEITEEDSDFDREIKQGVIDVKKDLAARIKKGENLVQILKDAREELMRSAEYKEQIGELVHEQLLNPDVSDDDLKDTIAAANKILESKGLPPMRETKFLRARERVLLAQERKSLNIKQ